MREKVLFCARYFMYGNDHLAKKFSQQILAIENLGYDVYYIGIIEKKISLFSKGKEICVLEDRRRCTIPILSNVTLYNDMYKALCKCFTLGYDFSYLYCRNLFSLRSSIKALNIAKACDVKVIMEIPTYPPMSEYKTEKRLARKILLYLADKRSRRFAKNVDLYALIGESSDIYLGRPAVNILNGIDVNKFPIREKKQFDGSVHILALATVCRWHGYDRLIEGFSNYIENGNENGSVHVHFVGGDGDGTLAELKKSVNEKGIQDLVTFHGPRFGEELDSIFNHCDIGVASLGLHRIGIYEASVLKIREYCARGLPIVYATSDTAINSDYPYAMQIPQSEQAVDIAEVLKFYESCSMTSEPSEKIREYAKKYMSWESQFELVFSKLAEHKL